MNTFINMEYYILLPADNGHNLNDNNLLGTVSIGSIFWPGGGLKILEYIVNNEPKLLTKITIINGKSTIISLDKFMAMLETFTIKKH